MLQSFAGKASESAVSPGKNMISDSRFNFRLDQKYLLLDEETNRKGVGILSWCLLSGHIS
jgi:hypothetical protein